MTKKYLKEYLTSLATREIQIKTPLRFYLTSVRMTKSRKPLAVNTGKGVGYKKGPRLLLMGLQTRAAISGSQSEEISKG